jgi:hypothetical protein
MKFFLSEGGSFSYDVESIGDIEVPLRYKHRVKQWVPKELPPIDVDFVVNNRTYRIAPSSLHGLGLFSMDGIIVKYNTVTKLMNYVGLCYSYNDWMLLVRYMQSMQRYALTTNYIQLINKDKNKGATLYIDGRTKASNNIARFINNTLPETTNKQPNFIYEGCEENRIVLCAIKKIAPGEELLVDYHLNQIETLTNSVQVLMQHLFKKPLLIALYFFIIFNIVVNIIFNIVFLLSLSFFKIFRGSNYIIMWQDDRGKGLATKHVNDYQFPLSFYVVFIICLYNFIEITLFLLKLYVVYRPC